MFIVRSVLIDKETVDHRFLTKKDAKEYLEDTLNLEQKFCKEIVSPIFPKFRTYNKQVQILILLEIIGEEKKCLERYELELRFKRKI